MSRSSSAAAASFGFLESFSPRHHRHQPAPLHRPSLCPRSCDYSPVAADLGSSHFLITGRQNTEVGSLYLKKKTSTWRNTTDPQRPSCCFSLLTRSQKGKIKDWTFPYCTYYTVLRLCYIATYYIHTCVNVCIFFFKIRNKVKWTRRGWV
jgi:hypothetical protein